MQDDRAGEGGQRRGRLLARLTAVDHDRPTELVGERELGVEQRALLPQGLPAVVAVQARLADCDGARVLEQLL